MVLQLVLNSKAIRKRMISYEVGVVIEGISGSVVLLGM